MSHALEQIAKEFDTVIGLEVHCQLKTSSKLFCSCKTEVGQEENSRTCPVCLGLPGALPVLDYAAVKKAVLLASSLSCKIKEKSYFSRKQYFYPDLPKGYQITQHQYPFAEGGFLVLNGHRKIELNRIHIEEDAGKSSHAGAFSYVDLNRAGTPLVEVVTEPCLSSAEEAVEFLKRLHSLVRMLEVSDANMEEGSFRCDANVSLKKRGQFVLGTRCEIKNLNSFKSVGRAINAELIRQFDLLKSGQTIVQATLLFDSALGKTQIMRTKTDEKDYRYFPDPDLRPLIIATSLIDDFAQNLPETPHDKSLRYQSEFGLNKSEAEDILQATDITNYFDLASKIDGLSGRTLYKWLIGDLSYFAKLTQWKTVLQKLPPPKLFQLISEVETKETISKLMAKKILARIFENDDELSDLLVLPEFQMVSDSQGFEKFLEESIQEFPKAYDDLLIKDPKVIGFFVGQIVKKSGGNLNPKVISEFIRKRFF